MLMSVDLLTLTIGCGRLFFKTTMPFLREAAIDSVRCQETDARDLYFSQRDAILNFPKASQVTRLTRSERRPFVDARR